jgi:hypothetical protein
LEVCSPYSPASVELGCVAVCVPKLLLKKYSKRIYIAVVPSNRLTIGNSLRVPPERQTWSLLMEQLGVALTSRRPLIAVSATLRTPSIRVRIHCFRIACLELTELQPEQSPSPAWPAVQRITRSSTTDGMPRHIPLRRSQQRPIRLLALPPTTTIRIGRRASNRQSCGDVR